MKQKIILYAAVMVLIVSVVNLFVGNGKVYKLDLFSVISFGLAIAAFLLSLFAAWISWEFYKKSTDALDQVHASVNKIENVVGGVQNNITEIVQIAVKHWTQSAGAANTEIMENLIEEMKAELETLKAAAPEVEAKVNTAIARMERDVATAQEKVAFPFSGLQSQQVGPAIYVSQNMVLDEPGRLEGYITFKINRPTKNASCKLRVKNSIDEVKSVDLQMEHQPEYAVGQSIKLRQGVDQHGALNIHLAGGSPIPVGEYIVKVKADYV
ncbi:hypothetical protein ACI2J9_03625 [Pseudomonas fulva]|uniref:hypothetical protein n=1 Tax=Pseudomonas fulva TaxID=47880 RepID=UPI00384E0843